MRLSVVLKSVRTVAMPFFQLNMAAALAYARSSGREILFIKNDKLMPTDTFLTTVSDPSF